jgi:hypothetical protein
MNTISKTHQAFSRRLNKPRVLENPKEFLGPNFEAVLNFWLILDDLSKEQWRVVEERDDAFYNENRSEWLKARDLAWVASNKVVGWGYAYEARYAAHEVTKSNAAHYATYELIAMHKILENQQQPLTSLIFFPMFIDL